MISTLSLKHRGSQLRPGHRGQLQVEDSIGPSQDCRLPWLPGWAPDLEGAGALECRGGVKSSEQCPHWSACTVQGPVQLGEHRSSDPVSWSLYSGSCSWHVNSWEQRVPLAEDCPKLSCKLSHRWGMCCLCVLCVACVCGYDTFALGIACVLCYMLQACIVL